MKVKVFNKVTETVGLPEGNLRLDFFKTVELYILFNNQDVFEFVDNPAEADIIPIHLNRYSYFKEEAISDKWFMECAMHFNKNQVAVNINHLMHIDEQVMGRDDMESENKSALDPRSPFKKIIHLHNDISLRDENHNYESFIYTDFLFNRSHTMHFDNELVKAHWNTVDTKNHWWRHPTDRHEPQFPSSMFELTPDHKIIRRLTRFKTFCDDNEEITKKIFVSPNLSRKNILGPNDGATIRSSLRIKLGELLYNYHGYIGDISQGTALLAHRDSYNDFDILGIHGWGFSPPHNDYYDSSAISIYVETLTYNEDHASKCITEKTFTPMCKGHFVLPFGTPGTIDHLKSEYGFEFPHWLDYGYDNLQDVDNPIESVVQVDTMLQSPRWESYVSTVKSVCELGAARLYKLKENDFKSHNVILHNRSIMRDHGQKHGLHDPQILQEIMS